MCKPPSAARIAQLNRRWIRLDAALSVELKKLFGAKANEQRYKHRPVGWSDRAVRLRSIVERAMDVASRASFA